MTILRHFEPFRSGKKSYLCAPGTRNKPAAIPGNARTKPLAIPGNDRTKLVAPSGKDLINDVFWILS